MSTVMQVFLNSDMRNGHEGLEKLAKDREIDVNKLQPGQYVIFINAAKDRLKLFAANGVIAYVKLREGKKIDLRTIREIPKVFNGSVINYDSALKSVLEKALLKK